MNAPAMKKIQQLIFLLTDLCFRSGSEGRSYTRVFLAFLLLSGLGPIGCSGGSPAAKAGANQEAPPELVAQAELGLGLRRDLAPNSASEIGRGLLYKNDWIRTVPWSVHVLRIDRSRPDFDLVTTLSQNQILGLGPLSEQIRTIPSERGRPLAAINGDFYVWEREPYAGDPRGLQLLQGELVSAPDGTICFWIDPQGNPHMSNVVSQLRVTWPSGETTPLGLNEDRRPNAAVLYTPRLGTSTRTYGGREFVLERAGSGAWLPLRAGQVYAAQVREARDGGNTRLTSDIMVLSLGPSLAARSPRLAAGSLLKISTATAPDLSNVQTALGGGPQLVHEGKEQSSYDHRSHQRHPRAAFGWNAKHYFFVTVDGRQPGLSMGMTLPELAAYLAKLGCDEAMNLDGGGSAELWVEGKVVNNPCYGYERSTANALVLLRTNKSDPPRE